MENFSGKFVVFRIDSEYFGVDVMEVSEILRMMKITPLPEADYYIEGVIELRGKIINIIDFRKKFGYPEREYDEHSRIIIINTNDKHFGLIVDAVEAVEEYSEDELKKVEDNTQNRAIIGIITRKDKLITLLDFSNE